MPNVVIVPSSGILEFNTGTYLTSGLDTGIWGARFTANSGDLSLTCYNTGNSGRFSIHGSQGQLFSVDDNLSGSIFSVNTIAGSTLMEAFSDGLVRLGTYHQNLLNISGTGNLGGVGIRSIPDPAWPLKVSGNSQFSGRVEGTSGAFISRLTISGVDVATGAGGGPGGQNQTPWLSNIDAVGYSLGNVKQLSGTSGCFTGIQSLTTGPFDIQANYIRFRFGPADFTSSGIMIPAGPAVDYTGSGRLSFDSTELQFCVGTGATLGNPLSTFHKSITFTLPSPTDADVAFPIAALPFSYTIKRVKAMTSAGSHTGIEFQLEKRTGFHTAGTGIMTTAMVATPNGKITTSFSNSYVPLNVYLTFVAKGADTGIDYLCVEIDYHLFKT